MKTVRAYHQEQEFHNRFTAKNDGAVEANWKADYTASVTGPTVNLINNVSLALVSIFGSLMYMAGGITLGGVSSFVLYSRKFSGPINEFANILSEIQSALAAAEQVLTLCDLPRKRRMRRMRWMPHPARETCGWIMFPSAMRRGKKCCIR